MHRRHKFLGNITNIKEYLAKFIELCKNHRKTCEKIFSQCEVCKQFNKRLPRDKLNLVEKRIHALWKDTSSKMIDNKSKHTTII
jgi:hypothetical protein